MQYELKNKLISWIILDTIIKNYRVKIILYTLKKFGFHSKLFISNKLV